MVWDKSTEEFCEQAAECIFCGVRSDHVVVEENGYTARRCHICNLVYLSPRPTAETILALYGRDQAHVPAASHLGDGAKKRMYAKYNLSILRRYVKQGALLEIGTGAGFFLDEARKRGFDVFGIELNNIQADFVRRELGIPCEETPLDVCSFGTKKFDVIYHCDVISHFYDPIAEFRKIFHKLSPHGVLIFETGNFPEVKEKYYSAYSGFQFPDHLFFFGERNLRELLHVCGFELEQIYRFSILPQLWVVRYMRMLLEFGRLTQYLAVWISSRAGIIPSASGRSSQRLGPESWHYRIKRAVDYIHRYAIANIRYRLGSIMPKTGRPQTLIVTARKRSRVVNVNEK